VIRTNSDIEKKLRSRAILKHFIEAASKNEHLGECAVCCVLCAVCCVLCAVCCVLCAVCCVLCAGCWVLCAVFCVLCAGCCVLCAVCCVLCVVCCVLCAVCCVLCAVCCVLCAVCCVLCVVCCVQCAVCCVLFAVCSGNMNIAQAMWSRDGSAKQPPTKAVRLGCLGKALKVQSNLFPAKRATSRLRKGPVPL
jgi:hypothetical protein